MKSIRLKLFPRGALRLPFAHFEVLQGLAYRMMSFDPLLSEEVHDRTQQAGRQFKLFCFTDLHGRYRIESWRLVYREELEWEIRSADDRIIDAIEGFLRQNERLSVYGTECVVQSFHTEQRRFSGGAFFVKMDTPILVYETGEDGYVTYFRPEEERFAEAVVGNLEQKYRTLYGKPPEGGISFAPLRVNEKSKCVTRYKKTILTAYYGTYRLEAPEEILELAYYTGLGAKNSIGFGTVRDEQHGKVEF